ncbi:MAG: S41 family peptidase [Blastocatellia bacterium]
MSQLLSRFVLSAFSLAIFFSPTASFQQTSSLDGRWILTIEDDARRLEAPVDLRLEANDQVKLVLLGKTEGETGLFTGATNANRLLMQGRLSRSPAEINLTLNGDRMAGRITSERLQAEVSGVRAAAVAPEIPVSRYDVLLGAVLNGVNQNFYDPKLKGVSLDALRARHLKRVKAARNDGELAVAIRQMLAELGASHLEFFLSAEKPPVVQKQEPVVRRQLEAGVGYLALLDFPAENLWNYDGLLNLAMAEMVKYPALVIDLRGNRGERLEAALAALNIILPEGRPVAYVATRGAMARMKVSGIDRIDPAMLPAAYADDTLAASKFQGAGMYLAGGKFKTPYRGKIALLVDEGCAGSCELFAAAMKEARAATLIGQRTRGALLLSKPVNFTIIGWAGFPRNTVRGWQLEVPTTEVRTAAGMKIEGQGVEPDIPVERVTTSDAALARAVEWVKATRADPGK